jgi:hypothetical protein
MEWIEAYGYVHAASIHSALMAVQKVPHVPAAVLLAVEKTYKSAVYQAAAVSLFRTYKADKTINYLEHHRRNCIHSSTDLSLPDTVAMNQLAMHPLPAAAAKAARGGGGSSGSSQSSSSSSSSSGSGSGGGGSSSSGAAAASSSKANRAAAAAATPRSRSRSVPRSASSELCRMFNSSKACTYNPCRFTHKCTKCNSSEHGATGHPSA